MNDFVPLTLDGQPHLPPEVPQHRPPPRFLFGREFISAFTIAARASTKTIDLITYRLGPTVVIGDNPFQRLLIALEAAAARSVHITIHFCPWGLPKHQRPALGDLLARLSDVGIKIRQSAYKTRLHAKLSIFDSKLAIIGSHNLTHHSLQNSGELSAMFPILQTPPELRQWLRIITEAANA